MTFEHDPVITPRNSLDSREIAVGLGSSSQPGKSMTTGDPRTNTLVALVAPELLGADMQPEQLRTTLRSGRGRVRVLVRAVCRSDLDLAAFLLKEGLPVEVILAPGFQPPGDLAPDLAVHLVRMPPGTTASQLDEFALALSDVVISDPRSASESRLPGMAERQKKPIIAPGGELPALAVVSPDIAGRLDTEKPHWRYFGSHVFGRLEQFFLELFAFNWRGKARGGFKYSGNRLKRSFRWYWAGLQRPYFAPEDGNDDTRNWKKLVPDSNAADDSALIVQRFDAMDHCALHGSFLHRDVIWFAHFASAFAVFFAVAGALHNWPFGDGRGWPITELVTLVLVGVFVLSVRYARLLDQWTSCRLAAEQLRTARLCLPLLVVPWALRGSDEPPPGAFPFTVSALNLVKRAVRDQGVPRLPEDFGIARGVAWLDLIVADQAGYHRDNHRRLERAEHNLNVGAAVFYFAAIVAVAIHFTSFETDDLLILTAAGPAFAAAFHGVATRLGLVHRVELSRDTEVELSQIHGELQRFDMALPADQAWPLLRGLALRASDAMGNENTSWHSLVRREKDEV